MCGGVSKSGSPEVKPMMLRPCARSSLTRPVAIELGEGRMRCTREASVIMKEVPLRFRRGSGDHAQGFEALVDPAALVLSCAYRDLALLFALGLVVCLS